MTPKEKANEICAKYYSQIEHTLSEEYSPLANNPKFTGREMEIREQGMDEVVKVYATFFNKPFKNQRNVLLMLIWWSIKRYFKIIFK